MDFDKGFPGRKGFEYRVDDDLFDFVKGVDWFLLKFKFFFN